MYACDGVSLQGQCKRGTRFLAHPLADVHTNARAQTYITKKQAQRLLLLQLDIAATSLPSQAQRKHEQVAVNDNHAQQRVYVVRHAKVITNLTPPILERSLTLCPTSR